MSQRKSTRQRLVQAALELFAAQGVTETTTRQIAELAEVNEVTLFRHFGSKHGLLLAVLEESAVFTQLGQDLAKQATQIQGFAQALKIYANSFLQALEQIPEFVRSLVGEAGQYPIENQQAIGRGLVQLRAYTVQYLVAVMAQEQVRSHLSTAKLASLMNTLLLGYAVMEFTTKYHELWPDRDAFLADLVELFVFTELTEQDGVASTKRMDQVAGAELSLNLVEQKVMDLPAPLVRSLLQQARKSGLQDYALAYVLFGSGLRPEEAARLQRSHAVYDEHQHLLQITQGAIRQVPLNQWILGYHYGSYTKNPLTQWIKTRKDSQSALFITEAGEPMSEADVRQHWELMTRGLLTPTGQSPKIEQAQQTWCVEMLMRGMPLEGLSLLTGYTAEQLQPYVHRAQERAALEEAIRLDQRARR